MLFSIVIPTYNRSKTILRAVQSILNQTYQNFEVVIVDDGSTDNTLAVITPFLSEKVSYHKIENGGVAHARNQGIKLSNGEYIGFLDSDDFFFENHLSTAFEHISKNLNPDVLHLNFKWGDVEMKNAKSNKLPKKLPEDIFKGCSLHVNCTFINSNLKTRVQFNEDRNLMYSEDWDFFIKLCVNYDVKLLDIQTSYLMDHEDRSMRNFKEDAWLKRKEALIQSLKSDEVFMQKYSSNLPLIAAHMYSLIALMLALEKRKKDAANYLKKSFKSSKKEIFTIRTLAILKHLLLR